MAIPLEPIIEELSSLRKSISSLERDKPSQDGSEDVYVENLDEIKLHLRDELDRFGKSLKSIIEGAKLPSFNISETIRISNLGDLQAQLVALSGVVKSLKDQIDKIDFNPVINVPDVIVPDAKYPEINIPAPIVNVPQQNVEIDIGKLLDALDPLKFISDRANKPISVRMSDGNKFIKAVTELKTATQQLSKTNENLGIVYAGQSGITTDDLRSIGMAIPRSGGHKVVTVTSAGTPHNLSSGTTSSGPSLSARTVYLSASTDTGYVLVVGFSNTVRATSGNKNGIIVVPGNPPVQVEINDLNLLWVDSETSGGKLCVGYTA